MFSDCDGYMQCSNYPLNTCFTNTTEPWGVHIAPTQQPIYFNFTMYNGKTCEGIPSVSEKIPMEQCAAINKQGYLLTGLNGGEFLSVWYDGRH